MKTFLSIIGGLLVTLAIGFGFNEVSKGSNPENQITTSGGLTVNMGKVNAQLAQTRIEVGTGVGLTVPLLNGAIEIKNLMAEAGADDTSLLKGNLTVCLASAITYKTELQGLVTTKIASECRNFTPGMMGGTIWTFAEDYTAKVKVLYDTKYNFIKE